MSRVIQTNRVGTERNRLIRSIVISLRELMKQDKPDSTSKDLAAYIVLALDAVDGTIETTVRPWEKRDYWIKADRFRRDWEWVRKCSHEMRQGLLEGDWGEVAAAAAQVGMKVASVEVSDKHRMGKPWIGAWQRLLALEKGK